MPPLAINVRTLGTAEKFCRGPVAVSDRWKPVDARRPDVRRVLVDSVGVHVRIHPHDLAKLPEAGLQLRAGRLVDVEAAEAAVPVAVPHEGMAETRRDRDDRPRRGGAR